MANLQDIKSKAREKLQQLAPPIPEAIGTQPGEEVITRASGDPLTGTQGLLPDLAQRADDTARAVASGASFGLADEFAGTMTALTQGSDISERIDAERERDLAIPGKAKTAGEIAGVVAGAGILGRAGLSLLPGAERTAKSLIGRGAAEGAILGAGQGFGRGEGLEDRVFQAVRGGLTGTGTGAVLGGLTRGIIGGSAKPTLDVVKAEASAAYKAAENAGVIIKANSVGKMVGRIEAKLAEAGFDSSLHPQAFAALRRLQDAKFSNQTLNGLEILRRVVRNAGDTKVPSEGRIVGIMIDEIDSLATSLGRRDLVTGAAGARIAVGELKNARKLWSVTRKAELINGLVNRAGVRAGQFSGSGYENALRTEFRALALNPKKLRGFTDAEQRLITRIAAGTPISNALRNLGKFAPRGIVSTALSGGIGQTIAGPAGAAAALGAGEVGRAAATQAARGQIQRLGTEVLAPATRGPVNVTPQQSDVVRALIQSGVAGERLTSQ
ncbi:MAG: hypothetical protein ACR2QC_04285 [Gammaproteobacteria bacterium]